MVTSMLLTFPFQHIETGEVWGAFNVVNFLFLDMIPSKVQKALSHPEINQMENTFSLKRLPNEDILWFYVTVDKSFCV